MPRGDRTALVVFGILWIVVSAFVIYAATIPFRFTDDEQIVLMKIAHLSADPLADTWARGGGRVSVMSVVLDIAFFLPFGALGGLTARETPMGPRSKRILLVTLLGFFLSLSVETLQVFTRDRIPSSTDLVANTTGAFTGAWLVLRRRP